LAAENWKERWPKEVLAALGMTSEIYLLEHVLWVGVATVTNWLEVHNKKGDNVEIRNNKNIFIN
jgi:hypothetical protein